MSILEKSYFPKNFIMTIAFEPLIKNVRIAKIHIVSYYRFYYFISKILKDESISSSRLFLQEDLQRNMNETSSKIEPIS